MTTTPQAALLSRMHWLREETRRISNVTLAGNFTNPEDRAYWADRLKKLTTELSALENRAYWADRLKKLTTELSALESQTTPTRLIKD